jgi:hypothetical protein
METLSMKLNSILSMFVLLIGTFALAKNSFRTIGLIKDPQYVCEGLGFKLAVDRYDGTDYPNVAFVEVTLNDKPEYTTLYGCNVTRETEYTLFGHSNFDFELLLYNTDLETTSTKLGIIRSKQSPDKKQEVICTYVPVAPPK